YFSRTDCCFFFQAEDGIRVFHVTEFRRVLFRSDQQVQAPEGRRVEAGPRGERVHQPVRLLRQPPALPRDRLQGLDALRVPGRVRSEERRVGKEWRAGGATVLYKKQARESRDE